MIPTNLNKTQVRTWKTILPFSLLLGWGARIISPFLCMFITRTVESDTVKRLGKKIVSLPRDNLWDIFSGFNTHDNNTDEWWYGMYNVDSKFAFIRNWTQEDYDNSKVIRWWSRVMWLQRNSAYGYNYAWFSKPYEETVNVIEIGEEDKPGWSKTTIRPSSWQYQAVVQFPFGKVNSINIGWKAHKGKPKLLFAGRILGLRTASLK